MRVLTSHRTNDFNNSLVIEVLDDPSHGNACHKYLIKDVDDSFRINIDFQCGPVKEFGLNGLSIESLLAIVEDRLLGFQSGDYSCRENAIALTKIQEAMMWLGKRTADRIARNVEGTSIK